VKGEIFIVHIFENKFYFVSIGIITPPTLLFWTTTFGLQPVVVIQKTRIGGKIISILTQGFPLSDPPKGGPMTND